MDTKPYVDSQGECPINPGQPRGACSSVCWKHQQEEAIPWIGVRAESLQVGQLDASNNYIADVQIVDGVVKAVYELSDANLAAWHNRWRHEGGEVPQRDLTLEWPVGTVITTARTTATPEQWAFAAKDAQRHVRALNRSIAALRKKCAEQTANVESAIARAESDARDLARLAALHQNSAA